MLDSAAIVVWFIQAFRKFGRGICRKSGWNDFYCIEILGNVLDVLAPPSKVTFPSGGTNLLEALHNPPREKEQRNTNRAFKTLPSFP